MEKRGERKEGVPVLALAKCLLASYVLTLLLLCLLALLLYKLHLTEQEKRDRRESGILW